MKTLTSFLVYGFAFTLLLVTLYSLYLHESARPSEYDIGGNKASVIWNVAGQRSLQAKAEAPRFRSRYRCVNKFNISILMLCIIDAASYICMLIDNIANFRHNISSCICRQSDETHSALQLLEICIDQDEPHFHPCFLAACTNIEK